MTSRFGPSRASIVGAMLATLVSAVYVGDAQGIPTSGGGFYGTFASGVADKHNCVTGAIIKHDEYNDGEFGKTLADGIARIPPTPPPTFDPCQAEVEARSAAAQSTGGMKAFANAGGSGVGYASAALYASVFYHLEGPPFPAHITLHIPLDMVITGTASANTFWKACIEAFPLDGTVRSPDCGKPPVLSNCAGCVAHLGDSSPVAQTLHVDFDVDLTNGEADDFIILHAVLSVEADGTRAPDGTPLYNSIDLSQSAYIRQTLPPGVTFESDSGFLSESPFNSPGPGSPVPEPSAATLLASGLALLVCLRRSAWVKILVPSRAGSG